MAKAGVFSADNTGRKIDKPTSSATGGWQTVHTIKATQLPTRGNKKPYTFIVWADIGWFAMKSGSVTPDKTVFEFAIGPDSSSDLVFGTHIHRVPFSHGVLKDPVTSQPVQMILHADLHVDPGGWDTDVGLALKARIYRNGDPATVLPDFAFVFSSFMIAMDRSALDAGEFAVQAWQPASRPLPVQTFGFGQVDPGSVSFGKEAEDWLVFSAYEYLPNNKQLAPHIQTTLYDLITPGANPVYGHSPITHIRNGNTHGKAWGRFGHEGTGKYSRVQAGAFQVVTLEADNAKVGLRATQRHGGTATNSRDHIERHNVFAVNLNQFTFAQHFTDVYDGVPPEPLLDRLYNDVVKGGKEFRTNVEFKNSHYSDYIALFRSVPYRNPTDGVRGYGMLVEVDDSDVIWSQPGVTTSGIGEVQPNVVPARDTEFRPDLTKLTYRVQPGQSQVKHLYHATEVTCVGFFLERVQDQVAFPDEVPGPEIPIVPGRESLDVSALPVPPIDPATFFLDSELAESVFEADMNYRITMPVGIGSGAQGSLVWPSLTAAQRDQVMAWMGSLSSMTIAATPGDSSAAKAFSITSAPRSTQKKQRHTVEVDVVELVWSEGP